MLDGLRMFLTDPMDEEDGWVFLRSAAFEETSASLLLTVVPPGDPKGESRWELVAHGLRGYCISEPHGDLVLTERDHALALAHSPPTRSLYFRGRPASPEEILGRLLLSHRAVLGGWLPFERFLNPCVDPDRLLASGAGLLASGPACLLDSYAEALRAGGLEPYFLRETTKGAAEPPPLAARRREASARLRAYGDGLLATVTIGASWLVAEHFEANRIPRSAQPGSGGSPGR
jgi:hypothetical protein